MEHVVYLQVQQIRVLQAVGENAAPSSATNTTTILRQYVRVLKYVTLQWDRYSNCSGSGTISSGDYVIRLKGNISSDETVTIRYNGIRR